MKYFKSFSAALVFAALCVCVNSVFAETYYEGEGGKKLGGIRVYEPEWKGQGQTADERLLPARIQTELINNLSKYAGIFVSFKTDNETYDAELTLTGKIEKESSGKYMLSLNITDKNGLAKYSYGPARCTLAGLSDLIDIRKASASLITEMGIKLTDAGKRALGTVGTQDEIRGTDLAVQGKTTKNEVESLLFFQQAVGFDQNQLEAASLIKITAANISSGTMRDDVLNDIQWRKQWEKRLKECKELVQDYFKKPPKPSYTVVYTDDNLKQGKIDYAKETVDVNGVTIKYTFDGTALEKWTRQIQNVVKAVNDGLANTKRSNEWGLNSVRERTRQDINFTFTVTLYNEKGVKLSAENVQMRGSWTADTQDGFSHQLGNNSWSSNEGKFFPITFNGVNANLLPAKGKNFSVKFTEINESPTATVAKANNISILTVAEQQRMKAEQRRMEEERKKNEQKTSMRNATVSASARPGTTAGSILLHWRLVPDAAGYYIYRSKSSNGPYTKIANVSSPEYTDTGLEEGVTYYYKVSAFLDDAESQAAAVSSTALTKKIAEQRERERKEAEKKAATETFPQEILVFDVWGAVNINRYTGFQDGQSIAKTFVGFAGGMDFGLRFKRPSDKSGLFPWVFITEAFVLVDSGVIEGNFGGGLLLDMSVTDVIFHLVSLSVSGGVSLGKIDGVQMNVPYLHINGTLSVFTGGVLIHFYSEEFKNKYQRNPVGGYVGLKFLIPLGGRKR